MKLLEFIGSYSILIFIFIVVIFGLKENKNIFELFCNGVIEGEKIILKLFPTLFGLMISISMLSNSGFFEFMNIIISPFFSYFKIESQLIPLIILRPVSGSTTMAIATELMKKVGVDSKIGIIASIIMGATETTIFVSILYGSAVKIKDLKEVIIIGLIGDIICIISSILIYNLGIFN